MRPKRVPDVANLSKVIASPSALPASFMLSLESILAILQFMQDENEGRYCQQEGGAKQRLVDECRNSYGQCLYRITKWAPQDRKFAISRLILTSALQNFAHQRQSRGFENGFLLPNASGMSQSKRKNTSQEHPFMQDRRRYGTLRI